MPLIIKRVVKTMTRAVVIQIPAQTRNVVAEGDRKNKEVFEMPWIDQESCTGCGICVEKCPVNAISLSVLPDTQASEQSGMKVEEVEINMAQCIRCGVCHDVCPQGSVRHDSEKIPDLVKSNIEMTKRNMALCAKHLGSDKEKDKCLNRMIKYFNREKVIAEKTLEVLGQLADINDSGG